MNIILININTTFNDTKGFVFHRKVLIPQYMQSTSATGTKLANQFTLGQKEHLNISYLLSDSINVLTSL